MIFFKIIFDKIYFIKYNKAIRYEVAKESRPRRHLLQLRPRGARLSYPSLTKALTGKGIRVEKDNFYCRGQFKLLHRGRPNTADIEDAYAFAKRILLR